MLQARVDEILSAVLDMAPGRRAAAADQMCSGDAALRAEIGSLLEMLPEAEAYFGGIEEFATISPGDLTGRRVGAYRILAHIGSGGMGSVYRAERADGEFQGEVAIKVVSPLFAGPGFRRRFQTEKQALAALRHPNIAQLMDAGLSEDGSPYLVMELVDGVSIDRYCAERKLRINERIGLFLLVCDAAHFAHQTLIVHRDIKPANVMVTTGGVPKLLDFGIAKVIGEGAAQATLPQDRVMTPAYSSPELVRGEPISTASDTYSLGVLLYELLAGNPAIPRDQHLTETLRRICEWDPPPPSEAAGDVRLRRQLRGDLDNIILKAIRKEPAQRYSSVADFAADLRNYIAGRPVLALAPTHWYRLGKFVRRNRSMVCVGAFAVMAVMAGTVSVWRQAQIAERERGIAVSQRAIAEQQQKAASEQREIAERNLQVADEQRLMAEGRFSEVRELAKAVMFDYQAQLAVSGAETGLRARMAKDSIAYLDRLAAQRTGDRDLLLEIARGYMQVGSLLGAPAQPNLGDREGAARSYAKASAVLDGLARSNPDFAAAERARADVACLQGGLESSALPRCTSAWERLQKRYPEEAWVARGAAAAYTGAAPMMAGDRQIVFAKRAIEILDRLAEKNPDDLEAARNLALNYKYLAGFYDDANDRKQMLHSIQKAIEYDERRLKRFPDAPGIRLDLSFDLSMLGSFHERASDYENALIQFERVLDLRTKNLEKDPENVWLQQRVLFAYTSVGRMLLAKLDYAAAELVYNQGFALSKRLKQQTGDGVWNQIMWRMNWGYAWALAGQGAGDSRLCEIRAAALRHFAVAANLDGLDRRNAGETRDYVAKCQGATGGKR